MNNIKLVTDSASDVPAEIVEEYHIGVVELNVALGDEDVSHVSNSEFYYKMRNSSILPKTSAPSPDKFIEQFRTKEDVVMITLAEKLSSTYSAAKLAKEMHASENSNRIAVIDSLNGSMGETALVVMAGEMIKQGLSFEEIEKKLIEIREKVVHYGALDTLDNAVKGGRVNRTSGFIANALNIKAIVEIKDGVVKPVDKARGTKNAIKKLVDIFVGKVEESGAEHEYTTLFVAHANSPDKINAIMSELKDRLKFNRVVVSEIGPLMGTYAAEGAVLIAAL